MSAVQPVNAAIVGLGRWGQNLVRAMSDRPNPELQFVRGVTRTPTRAEEFAALHGFPVTDDFDAVLADPNIRAVVLATPHSQHCAQICKAAEAGKHVFVEKPLSLELQEARHAVAQCDAHDVLLAVGFNRRFLPAFKALSAASDAGTLGTALHIDANFSGPFGYDYSEEMWRGSRGENPAGGMAAMGIHMLDAMIHLLGPVHSVSTLSRRRAVSAPLDDTTTVQLEFKTGATGSLTTLMATAPNWRLQLFGSAGWGAMGDQHTLEMAIMGREPAVARYEVIDTLAEELTAFANCINRKDRFPVTRSEALAGVAALEAIALSAARQGERVFVAEV